MFAFGLNGQWRSMKFSDSSTAYTYQVSTMGWGYGRLTASQSCKQIELPYLTETKSHNQLQPRQNLNDQCMKFSYAFRPPRITCAIHSNVLSYVYNCSPCILTAVYLDVLHIKKEEANKHKNMCEHCKILVYTVYNQLRCWYSTVWSFKKRIKVGLP